MRFRIAVVTAVAAAALTGLVVGIATAASSSPPPPGPTTPYPPVPSDPDKCEVERILVAQAQLNYDAALEWYNKVLEMLARGASNEAELRAARAALDRAALALTNARYAEAVCQNNAANPGNPNNCVNLNLELNRLLDELAITKDLEAIAKANYEAAKRAYERGAISVEELRRAELAYEQAKLQTQLIQARIAEARRRLRDAGCDETVRPSPSPSPSPSGTGSPSASPSSSPSSSPAPSGTGPSTPPPDTARPSSTTVVPALHR